MEFNLAKYSVPLLALLWGQFVASPVAADSSQDESSNAYRRQFIVNMTKKAWADYADSDWWGSDTLGLVESGGVSEFNLKVYFEYGHTILDSMSTLWVMNLNEEIEKAKEWLGKMYFYTEKRNKCEEDQMRAGCLNVNKEGVMPISGLLSMYALTKDPVYLNKAVEVFDAVKTLTDGSGHGRSGILSFSLMAGLSFILSRTYMELRYLSDLTGNTSYIRVVEPLIARIAIEEKEILKSVPKESGFGYGYMKLHGDFMSTSAKSYYQSNGKDATLLKKLYDDVQFLMSEEEWLGHIQYFPKFGGTTVNRFSFKYSKLEKSKVGRLQFGRHCHYGAIFAYAAQAIAGALGNVSSWRELDHNSELLRNISSYWDWARGVVKLCKMTTDAKIGNAAGVVPHWFVLELNATKEYKIENFILPLKKVILDSKQNYLLDSRLVESYFVLWRLTKEPKYREWAWQFAQALYKNARTEKKGYSAIYDVTNHSSFNGGRPMYPEFLSGTLKYLYLIFSDDNVLPLDQWVFSPMGHPLPICERNPMYPKCG